MWEGRDQNCRRSQSWFLPSSTANGALLPGDHRKGDETFAGGLLILGTCSRLAASNTSPAGQRALEVMVNCRNQSCRFLQSTSLQSSTSCSALLPAGCTWECLDSYFEVKLAPWRLQQASTLVQTASWPEGPTGSGIL